MSLFFFIHNKRHNFFKYIPNVILSSEGGRGKNIQNFVSADKWMPPIPMDIIDQGTGLLQIEKK